MSKLIVKAITEHYGERCPDYDEDCFCCKVWSEYDALTTPAPCDELVRYDKGDILLALEGGYDPLSSDDGEYVRFEQAEAVIAAERMKLEATARVGLQLSEKIEAIEADNKLLREALKNLVERFSYYADLARDGVPNIEDWAYTEGSSDIAKARAALGEVKEG